VKLIFWILVIGLPTTFHGHFLCNTALKWSFQPLCNFWRSVQCCGSKAIFFSLTNLDLTCHYNTQLQRGKKFQIRIDLDQRTKLLFTFRVVIEIGRCQWCKWKFDNNDYDMLEKQMMMFVMIIWWRCVYVDYNENEQGWNDEKRIKMRALKGSTTEMNGFTIEEHSIDCKCNRWWK